VDLELGALHFPQFPTPVGETPYSYLCKLSFQGAQERYHPLTPEVLARLQHELEIVNDLGFAEYFLVVWDVARYARSRGIRYSGRGSAVNSILTYCLGVTTVDPIEHNLLFERFLNRERRGMPDVDIDFCARRRDEVIDYVYKTYGAGHVAMVCTLSTLNARSALRDVGRAMGTAPDQIDRLAKAMPHTGARNIRSAMESLPELRDASLSVARMRDLLDICEAVDGFPRHMSVHLAGILITRDPLTDYTPLEWSSKGVAVSQFNKDDVEALGLVKLDLLGLRNLSALDDAVANVKAMRGIEIDLDALPLDDPAVYALLRSTQTIGVFQLESPGMRGLLGRLQPERFHDLIINIALFRPGPMKANMIDPFIARRHGLEPICYLHPGLEPALSETYGVLIFQEQVLRIASAIAGFSLGQSDRFRKAMTHDRSTEEMAAIGSSFVEGAKANGVEEPVARSIFQQLSAFAAYGFCKAHAAAFAYIAYQTAYMKAHYPAEFLAGVLANEPMGFYSSSTIVQDARRMGIPVLTVHVNRSHERCGVEWTERSVGRAMGIRLGLAELRSMTEEAIQQIIVARGQRLFSSLRDFCVRTHVSRPIVENLVRCGAFAGLGPGGKGSQATAQPDGQDDDGRSRLLLWQIDDALRAAEDKEACLLDPSDADRNLYAGLQDAIPAPTLIEKVQDDYNLLGLTTCCHPIRFFRDGLSKRGAVCCAELLNLPHGAMVKAAGIVISCMKPPTRSGKVVVFVSLEDETGVIDCTVFPKVYDRWGYYLFHSSALVVEGRLQRLGARALNLLASKIEPLESPDAQPMPASRPDCPSGYRGGPASV
jgi:error-prone DNA polymerase